MKTLIKNVFLPDGAETDILIDGGIIARISRYNGSCEKLIDGSGLTAVPSFVDLHVHFRDPGFTYKEDILTGCKSAAAGGFTDVFPMPNTSPSCDSPEIVKYMLDKAKETGVRMYPVGAITKGLKGEELTDMESLAASGVKAFSDDGRPVLHRADMETAMKKAKELNCSIFAHCEDLELAGRGIINKGDVSKYLGVEGIPHEAEENGTAREIELAEKTGAKLHICHVSTKASVDMIRAAKKRGVNVTAETGPHYISLTEEMLLKQDADYRMNPPLRTEQDRSAIIEGILDGTIDAIATDHAPHSSDEKYNFLKAPNGVVGLETSFAVIYTYLVKTGIITFQKLIELMSVNPCKIAGIPVHSLKKGGAADITLVDINEIWTVKPEEFKSKAINSCFKGMKLTGKVKYTIGKGNIIYRN